jgi:outer membrane protein
MIILFLYTKNTSKILLHLFAFIFTVTLLPIHAEEHPNKPLSTKINKTFNSFWSNPEDSLREEIQTNWDNSLSERTNTKEYISVRDLYFIALNYSPSFKSNQAALDIAYASQLTANSVFYPTISAGYALTRSEDKTVPNYNQNILSLSLLQYLYNAESFAKAEQIDNQVDSGKIALRLARQRLIFNTAQRWSNLILAIENQRLSEIEIKSSKKLLDKVKQSLALGLGKKLDVAQAKAAHTLAIADQIQRKSNYTVALQNLQNLTGIKINTVPEWKKPNIQLATLRPYASKIRNNTTLQQQLKALDTAVLEVNAVRGRLYPKVSLRLAYNHTEFTEIGSQNEVNDPILATLNFEWELFSGFRTTADIDTAYAKLNQQKARLKESLLNEKANLDNTWALLQANEQRIPALQQQVEASKIAYDALLQGYQLGTQNLPDVLNAQSQYQKAQISLAQTIHQHWINYLNFKFIIGEITPGDLPS